MAVKRIAAETLIAETIALIRKDLAPALPADKRYEAAMAANALEIARRELTGDGEARLWGLLDSIYEEGEGSAAHLAADIRSGAVSEKKRSGLGETLLGVLADELAVRNPRFLKKP